MSSSEEQGRPAEPPVGRPGTLGSAISRAAGFFCFWLVLTGADAGDLAAGVLAARGNLHKPAPDAAATVEPASHQARRIRARTFCVNRSPPG